MYQKVNIHKIPKFVDILNFTSDTEYLKLTVLIFVHMR